MIRNNVVPNSCVSFLKRSKYISSAIMENYNEFITNIGLNELSLYNKNNYDVSYNNDEYDNLIESIIDLHSNNLNIIKESYKDIINEFDCIENIELNEAFFKNEPDIYYNKDKFDSGEINLCFITGLSGSGKSTMRKTIDDAIDVDLDKIIMYNYYDLDFFKKEGPILYGFITGPGSKYHISKEEKNKQLKNISLLTKVNKDILNDVLKYTINYANSHKDQKIVVDGVWLYLYKNPSEFDKYAVYIKGTSAVTSGLRAGKRGSNIIKNKGKLDRILYTINRVFSDIKDEAISKFPKWRSYFKKKIEEQQKETVKENSLYDILGDKSFCKVHKFFDYDMINFSENTNKFIDNMFEIVSESNNIKDSLIKYENFICNIISDIDNINSINEMNSILNEELMGKCIDVNSIFIESNMNEMLDIINSDNIIENIKESFTNESDTINYFINKVRCLDEYSLDYANEINRLMCLAECIMTDCYFKTFDVYKRMINEYKNVFIKSDSILNEMNIFRSRQSKLGHLKRKIMGNEVKDSINRNKEITKQNAKNKEINNS